MKIIHISDLHLNTEYKLSNNEKCTRALEFIVDSGFDHLVISGDITENSERSSYELARKMFRKFNLLNPDKLTLVIGNHDIFGGVHYAEDILDFPKRCKATNYDSKVSEFENYFPEVFKNTLQPDKNSMYPFVKEFDEFVLIGINTIARYSVLKNPFASNGDVDSGQLHNIEKICNIKAFEYKEKIIVAHHHFSKSYNDPCSENTVWKRIEKQTMKLRDKKKIFKLFDKYDIHNVMHGHLHESNQYFRHGIRFFNAGGATLGYKDEVRLNTFIIENDMIDFTINCFPVNTIKSKNYAPMHEADFGKLIVPADICLN